MGWYCGFDTRTQKKQGIGQDRIEGPGFKSPGEASSTVWPWDSLLRYILEHAPADLATSQQIPYLLLPQINVQFLIPSLNYFLKNSWRCFCLLLFIYQQNSSLFKVPGAVQTKGQGRERPGDGTLPISYTIKNTAIFELLSSCSMSPAENNNGYLLYGIKKFSYKTSKAPSVIPGA